MSRNERADYLVKLYLSWFSINRIVKLAKPVNSQTLKSITDRPFYIPSIDSVLHRFQHLFPVLYRLYIPDLVSRELVMGMTWTPTWKSVPNDNKGLLANRGMKGKDTIFTCLKYEIASVGVEVVHARQRDSDPIRILHYTSMFSRQTLKPFEPEYNRQVLELGWRAVKYDSLWLSDPSVGEPLWCSPGRLAAVLSGGGKRRIFIIGNFIKQRLFRPIHDWSMEILRSLPCDGTFNQSKPIERLVRAKASKVYSFDLSSATDRYPMRALFYLIWSIFGSIPAAAIVRHLAEGAILIKPPYTWRKRYIKFNTGQPLGYYGCWSLFSLSHHCMVWMAAANVDGRYRQKPFTDYALLGDDIVIINPAVAKEYKRIMVKLGVSISEGKSLVSSNGSFEFAKQFWVKRGQVNLSPVSAPAVLAARSFIGLTQLGLKYKVSKNVILRLNGVGFRTRSRLSSWTLLSRKTKRLLTIVDKSLNFNQLPLQFWFGRGNPINPYYKGIIIADALRKYKFKDLVTVPEEYWKDDERQYNTVESTLYRSWIEDWLKWVKWYCEGLYLDKDLDYYFDPPLISTTWKRTCKDLNLIKYGFLWICWDKGDSFYSNLYSSYPFILPESLPSRVINLRCSVLCGCRVCIPSVIIYI